MYLYSAPGVLRFARRCIGLPLVALCALAVASAMRGELPGAAQYTVLRNFSPADGTGSVPTASLLQLADGRIYGVRSSGGTEDCGTIFSVKPDGTEFTVLKNFNVEDGAAPAAIVDGGNGKIYGITGTKGTGFFGTIFSINPDGSGFTTLHAFSNPAQGWKPASLIRAADGHLYGACLIGDAVMDQVALFRYALDGGGYIVLRTLDRATQGAGLNGVANVALVETSNGVFCGAAPGGGAYGLGTLFRFAPTGGFTVLRQMNALDARQPNRLMLTKSGWLYGTSYGASNVSTLGAVFRLRPDGSEFTIVHIMTATNPAPSGSALPLAGLVESDELLYGVSTSGGEVRDLGTLFRIDARFKANEPVPAPQEQDYMLLRALSPEDGTAPNAALLRASNGKLYGTTPAGGANGGGTLFSYTPATAVGDRVTGRVGESFGFPASALLGAAGYYAAEGLPAGLSINETTGDISGTPRQAGGYAVSLTSRYPRQRGPLPMTFEIAKALARITITGQTQAFDGTPKRVTVTTDPAGIPFVVRYDGVTTPPTQPGRYNVVVEAESASHYGWASATLAITATAPTITMPSAPPTVVAGAEVILQATVSGAPPFSYRWQRKAVGTTVFVDLVNDLAYQGVLTAELRIVAPTFSMNGDEFRLVVANAARTVASDPITLTVLPSAVLTNVSILTHITPGEPLSVGFVTSGPRSILIRAVGPGLASLLGAGGTAAGNPALLVRDARQASIAANDDWGGSDGLTAAFAKVGAFGLTAGSQDAAVLAELSGAATAQMTVTQPGLGLIEVYDTTAAAGARIVNLSALHRVGSGSEGLTAGFNVAGAGTKRLLIRGIGPGLRAFGLPSVLADVRIEVLARGASVLLNDDWSETLVPTFTQAGAFMLPVRSKDAALIFNAAPGAYTVQLTSTDGSTGPGLIEIYELP